MGIGKSAEAKALEQQQAMARKEAEQARRDAEIALAEKKAKKGQEIANVKLGTASKKQSVEDKELFKKNSTSTPSSSLAIGGNKGKTGVQI